MFFPSSMRPAPSSGFLSYALVSRGPGYFFFSPLPAGYGLSRAPPCDGIYEEGASRYWLALLIFGRLTFAIKKFTEIWLTLFDTPFVSKCFASEYWLPHKLHFIIFFKVLDNVEEVDIVSHLPFIKAQVALSLQSCCGIQVSTVNEMLLNHDQKISLPFSYPLFLLEPRFSLCLVFQHH